MIRTLIVTSCTADKLLDGQMKSLGLSGLSASDFYYNNTAKIATLKNNGLQRDAYSMYVGRQYGPYKNGKFGPVKEAISNLKATGLQFDHYIVSAGYGIIKSTDLIVPYDVSFNHSAEYFRNETNNNCRNFKQWGDFLQIRITFDSLIEKYDLIIVLLASKYTEVLKLDKQSLSLSPQQKILYFDSPDKLPAPSKQFEIIDPMQFNNNKYASKGSAFNFTIRGHLLYHLLSIFNKYYGNTYKSFFDYLYSVDSIQLINDLNSYKYPNP